MLIGNCDFGLNTLQIRQASVCTDENAAVTLCRPSDPACFIRCQHCPKGQLAGYFATFMLP